MQNESKDEYDSRGYVAFRNLISEDKIATMNAIIDELSATLKVSETVFDESGTGKIKQIQQLHTYHEVFVEIVEQLRPIAEQLTGSQALKLLNMQLFEKHPEISKPTRAHQDNAYFKMTPATPITFWISLDTIDEANGCLYYAPYTHLTPTRRHQRYHPHTTFRIRSGVAGLSLCLHEHPEECDVAIITQPGDVLAHNCNTIHRAGKNNSEWQRRAIGVVFIPEECQLDERLERYHQERLKDDIELQKYKDPILYERLKKI